MRSKSFRHLFLFAIAILWSAVASAQPTAVQRLIVSNFGSTFYNVNLSDGSMTAISRAFLTPFFNTADFRNDGLLYGLQGSTLYRIDFSGGTSAWTQLVTLADGGGQIAFDPNDQLFVSSGSTLRRVNIANGQSLSTVTVKMGSSSVSLQGIDFSPQGILYGIGTQALYTIDPNTGAASQITSNSGNPSIMTELDYGADGVLRAILSSTTTPLWQLNPATGAGAPIAGTQNASGAPFSSIASLPVPEPSPAVLFSMGTICLMTWLLSRRVHRV
jgi:hypothetical protein